MKSRSSRSPVPVRGSAKIAALPSVRRLALQLLEVPQLPEQVRSLAPETLGALVRHVGIEEAGELVALATPSQLVRLLDEDVWQSNEPGADETLDADRFATWLHVLLEAGEDALADKMVELPMELVLHAMSRLVIVLDMDELGSEVASLDEDEADELEKALDSCLYQEIEQYRVVARRHEGFDNVVAVLLALDKNHHAYLRRLLERLAAASESFADEHGGLFSALSNLEMIQEDASAEREERRAKEGYVAAASARAFLALSTVRSVDEILAPGPSDAVTRAYFRDLEPQGNVAAQASVAGPLAQLIAQARAEEAGAKPSRAALPKKSGQTGTLNDELQRLAETAPELCARRREELAYLVNVVVAAGWQGQSIRPREATAVVIETVEAGIREAAKRAKSKKLIVETVSIDKLFLAGLAKLKQKQS